MELEPVVEVLKDYFEDLLKTLNSWLNYADFSQRRSAQKNKI